MTKQEELDLYKKALVDWEKPIEQAEENRTEFGFCNYFYNYPYHFDLYSDFKEKLPELYKQRLSNRLCHYHSRGDVETGRQQRVTALKNAISILEKQLKDEG